MSQYKFKRKNADKSKSKVMNANATPEESTTVFSKSSVNSIPETEEIIDPYADDNPKGKKSKDKKKGVSVFKVFSKHSNDTDGEVLDTDEAEILAKAEDIINGTDVPVDKLKESLSKDGKISLADVFSSKKAPESTTEALDVTDSTDDSDKTDKTVKSDKSDNSIKGDSADKVDNGGDSDKTPFDDNSSSDDDEQDIYDDTDDVEDIPVMPKPKKEKKVAEICDFDSFEDKEDFLESYHKKEKSSIVSLVFSVISLLALIYLETKSLPHPKWMLPGNYSFMYLMLDLQFVFISGVCVFSALKSGAAGLFAWKPNKHSATFISFTVAVIQILLHVIFSKLSTNITLYSSVFGACAAVSALISYIDARREHLSFRVVASSKTKTTVTELGENSVECRKYGERFENASMYKVTRTSFLKDFVKTNMRQPVYDDDYKVSIPLVFVASVVFAAISFILTKGSNASTAINNFALAFMMGLPLSSLFIVSLPFYITSLKLAKSKSAIIGEASIEEFANAPLVSLEDTDIFKTEGVTITSIKSYGKTRIDDTYLFVAKVFKLVGGPLEGVFGQSVICFENGNEGNSILAVAENGINALIDSRSVLVGNEKFMRDSGVKVPEDEYDVDYYKAESGKILYVAVDGEVSAKFYIKYVIGKKFKKLLNSFTQLGICIALNTRDPNVDTDFLLKILKDKTYPIVAVKNTDIPTNESKKPVGAVSGGIVSTESIHKILRTFIASDKLSHVISMNALTKYISLILAFTLIVVAFLTNSSHEKITPLFIILYQLVWSIPIIGTSFFQ